MKTDIATMPAEVGSHGSEALHSIFRKGPESILFPDHLKLVPQLNEVYELCLAYYESQILSSEQIVNNGAYFSHVEGRPTRHFLMCQGEPVRLADHSSSRLKSFFKSNQFKTGYATHGLFPYRGKFHPQMIKGLINVMGLKPGDTVLDPMMGSGTVLIEATLMGICSIGVDASPFCQFMTQAKLDGLTIPLGPIKKALDKVEETFSYFKKHAPAPKAPPKKSRRRGSGDLFVEPQAQFKLPAKGSPVSFSDKRVRNFLFLAYLDGIGYSLRSNRKSPLEQFAGILERYYFAAEKIQTVLNGMQDELADAKSLCGDARKLELEDRSIDGVIFSPPYSFAIDYLDNDAYHLAVLNENIEALRTRMIGLRGSTLKDQYDLYLEDMTTVLGECARVLKPGAICAIVVGTNNRQLAKILGTTPDDVKGIPELLVESAEPHGMKLLRMIERQITGMANTMRTEYIVMLQRLK